MRLAVALVLAVALNACGHPADTDATASATQGPCNLANFLAVQHAHVNHAEVTLCGTVVRVRQAYRSRSGVHRAFFVDVGNGDVIVIDANLDVMGNFPIHAGEATTIRGEYYYDEDGREGIHWTHRTDYGSHPAGYVILDGTRYD
jgi:hypothetical protein